MNETVVNEVLAELIMRYRDRFLPPDDVDPDAWHKGWVKDLADLDDDIGREAVESVIKTATYPPVPADIYRAAEGLGWTRPAPNDFWDRLRKIAAKDHARTRRFFGRHGEAVHFGFSDDPPLRVLDAPSVEEVKAERREKADHPVGTVLSVNDKTALVRMGTGWAVKRTSSKQLLGDYATPEEALAWVVSELRRRGQNEEADELERTRV